MKWLLPKNWRPLFIENSKIPGWLSKIAPINIGAITLFPFVISRHSLNESTRRHETIHFVMLLHLIKHIIELEQNKKHMLVKDLKTI